MQYFKLNTLYCIVCCSGAILLSSSTSSVPSFVVRKWLHCQSGHPALVPVFSYYLRTRVLLTARDTLYGRCFFLEFFPPPDRWPPGLLFLRSPAIYGLFLLTCVTVQTDVLLHYLETIRIFLFVCFLEDLQEKKIPATFGGIRTRNLRNPKRTSNPETTHCPGLYLFCLCSRVSLRWLEFMFRLSYKNMGIMAIKHNNKHHRELSNANKTGQNLISKDITV